MNSIGDWFRKYIFSENQDTYERNVKNNETFTNKTQSVCTENQNEGVMSSMVEGLNRAVATMRTSVSDYGHGFSLFNGSATRTMSASGGLQHPRYFSTTSVDDETFRKSRQSNNNCVGSFGFVIPRRRRTESCGARSCRAHGCENLKIGNGEKTLNLKRSTATNDLNSLAESSGSKSPYSSNSERSLPVKERKQRCVIEEPSLNEEDEHETASSDMKQDKPSFMDIVRNNLKSLERNIVLRHRRYNRRAKRQRLADFYRKKYSTEDVESPKANKLKEEPAIDETSKGISRLFNFVRTKVTVQRKCRTDSVRKRVAIKMEKRKGLFKRQSRVEIVAHFRRKYLKDS